MTLKNMTLRNHRKRNHSNKSGTIRLNIRLQYKLGLAFFFSFILPVIIFGFFLMFSFTRILGNNLFTSQEVYLNELKNDVDRFVIDLHRLVRTVSYDIPFTIELAKSKDDIPLESDYKNHSEKIVEHLEELVKDETSVLGFYMLTDKKQAFHSRNLQDIESSEVLIDHTVFAGIQERESAIALYRPYAPAIFSGFSQEVLLFAAQINVTYLDEKVIERGVMVLVIDRNAIDSLIQLSNRPSDQIYLYSNQGDFIYSKNAAVAYKALPEKLTSQLAQLKAGRYKITGSTSANLVSFDTSRFNTIKYLSISSDQRIKKDTLLLNRFTLIFLFSLIAVIFYLVVRLSRSISLPINRLEHIMGKLEASNYNDVTLLAVADHKGILSPYFSHLHQFLLSVITKINTYHRQEKEHELMILQSQINPHFMYNSLNTIRVMAELEGHSKIASAVRSLIHLLRNSIRIGVIFISIRDEVEQIKDYISLQQLRYNDSFTVNFDIDEIVYPYKCIKFILQPIVENAIFHGVNPSNTDGVIKISIKKEQKSICYSISDNGKGFDIRILKRIPDQELNSERGEKIGLKNVNSRLETYFGPDSQLRIVTEKDRGTVIKYTIPAELFGKTE